MNDLQTRLNLAAAKWQTYSAMVGYCQGRLEVREGIPACGEIDREMMEHRQEQARSAYEEFLTELRKVNDERD